MTPVLLTAVTMNPVSMTALSITTVSVTPVPMTTVSMTVVPVTAMSVTSVSMTTVPMTTVYRGSDPLDSPEQGPTLALVPLLSPLGPHPYQLTLASCSHSCCSLGLPGPEVGGLC